MALGDGAQVERRAERGVEAVDVSQARIGKLTIHPYLATLTAWAPARPAAPPACAISPRSAFSAST